MRAPAASAGSSSRSKALAAITVGGYVGRYHSDCRGALGSRDGAPSRTGDAPVSGVAGRHERTYLTRKRPCIQGWMMHTKFSVVPGRAVTLNVT